jgi:membrane dipeptidase
MSLHEKLIVIDGLVISKWGGEVFQALREGGVTAINATCAVWENSRQTLDNLAQWYHWFGEYADIIIPIRQTKDIEMGKAAGKTGIILSFQNGSPIEDRLDYLAIFKQLGVGIIQIVYNTWNLIGGGCYEMPDPGLSGFGREVIDEMNHLGIAIDLSHVGSKTTDDVIAVSKDPVLFSHVCPYELKKHPRNKETRQLKAVAEKGGLVGVTCFFSFLPKGDSSTVDDYADVIEWMVNHCGEDHIVL